MSSCSPALLFIFPSSSSGSIFPLYEQEDIALAGNSLRRREQADFIFPAAALSSCSSPSLYIPCCWRTRGHIPCCCSEYQEPLFSLYSLLLLCSLVLPFSYIPCCCSVLKRRGEQENCSSAGNIFPAAI